MKLTKVQLNEKKYSRTSLLRGKVFEKTYQGTTYAKLVRGASKGDLEDALRNSLHGIR